MKKENKYSYLQFLYIAGLSWLNIYIFFRLLSLAANFARTYVSLYQNAMAHVMTLLFFAVFFLLFRNLARLALAIRRDPSAELMEEFKNVGLTSVVILLLVLIIQTVPEVLLTASFQLQGF